MARPAKYDCNEVLCKAMLLFWERGYRGVSMSDLVAATGLLPGSLYARFGNKEGLFLECMDHYHKMSARVRAEHEGGASPLGRVSSFYDTMVEQMVADEAGRGCFIVNASLESDGPDTAIKAKVRQCLEEGEGWLAEQLELAVKAGELREGVDCRLVAGCLVSAFYGYRVISRAEDGRERLRALARETFERLVGPWRQPDPAATPA